MPTKKKATAMCLVRDSILLILRDPKGVPLRAKSRLEQLLKLCGHEDILAKMVIMADRWVMRSVSDFEVPRTSEDRIRIAYKPAGATADYDPFTIHVGPVSTGLEIGMPGYGLCEMEPGFEGIIVLESWQGSVNVCIWDDINDPDCYSICVDEAVETNRRETKSNDML